MNVLDTVRRGVWNDAERRARAPFRIVAAVFVLVLLGLALGFLLAVVGVTAPTAMASLLLFSLVSAVAVVVGLVPIARFVDRRRYADYGLRIDREWWIDCGFGLALGAGLQTTVFLVGWAAGWYVPTGTFVAPGSFVLVFGAVLLAFLAVGVYEELLVRGWLLGNIAEGLRFAGERGAVAVAVAVSSGLFGLLHAANPGATLLSTAVISLAGVFLALGYVLTGELAIPIGIHVTWNLFQGAVYGFGVSGLAVPATVVETRVAGPELVTGGEFGPEAGLAGLAAVLVGCVAVAGWVRWRVGDLSIHPAVTRPALLDAGDTASEPGDAGANVAGSDVAEPNVADPNVAGSDAQEPNTEGPRSVGPDATESGESGEPGEPTETVDPERPPEDRR